MKANQRKKSPGTFPGHGALWLVSGNLAERLDSAPSPVTDRRDSGKPPEPSIGSKQASGEELGQIRALQGQFFSFRI
jgi:hypothetical protein